MTSEDTGHREWMRNQLRIAAGHFSLTTEGVPVFGWRDRTIGSRAIGPSGVCWLRVSWAHPRWAEGSYWTGNQDAIDITGVPKPHVLEIHEWGEENYRNRAEVMTYITDRPCSETQELQRDVILPGEWWRGLRDALDTLATSPTERTITTPEKVNRRLLSYFGSSAISTVTSWTTAHGDLNWTNLTEPNVCLLDWESFGKAPAGYDAATLYVLSLRTPETAKKVHETFFDVLNSPDGICAQFYVIARFLKRVENGDFAELADVLHQHARNLLNGL